MKMIFLFLLPIILASCCFGNRKCNQDYNSSRFRILDKTNGNDLIFGPTKIYDKNIFRFYSITGTDTIFHHSGAAPNPNSIQDSILFVDFDFRKMETVFLRISNTDIDTLKLTYQIIDPSPCCQDYTQVKPVFFNNSSLEQITGGITILKK